MEIAAGEAVSSVLPMMICFKTMQSPRLCSEKKKKQRARMPRTDVIRLCYVFRGDLGVGGWWWWSMPEQRNPTLNITHKQNPVCAKEVCTELYYVRSTPYKTSRTRIKHIRHDTRDLACWASKPPILTGFPHTHTHWDSRQTWDMSVRIDQESSSRYFSRTEKEKEKKAIISSGF